MKPSKDNILGKRREVYSLAFFLGNERGGKRNKKHASLLTIDSYRTLTCLLPFGLSGYLF
jgi:hypothetical protein